jgi:flagellar basal body-associated protein FliL
MNIKQKILSLVIGLSSLTLAALVAPTVQADCGNAKTSIISCSQDNKGTNAKDNAVWGVLLIALNILTAGVGIAAVGGIVYGSILYSSAGDSAEQTKRAKQIIRDVVIGLVAFGLMYLVLNYLIPGGIFS